MLFWFALCHIAIRFRILFSILPSVWSLREQRDERPRRQWPTPAARSRATATSSRSPAMRCRARLRGTDSSELDIRIHDVMSCEIRATWDWRPSYVTISTQHNGVHTPWSSGQLETTVSRLKRASASCTVRVISRCCVRVGSTKTEYYQISAIPCLPKTSQSSVSNPIMT